MDPLVRLLLLVARPHQVGIDEGRAREIWAAATPTVTTQIYGPHFEHLCRVWLRRYTPDSWLGEPIGFVGPTQLPDRARRQAMELEAVVLASGEVAQRASRRILAVAEAKPTARPVGIDVVERLARSAALLDEAGQDVRDVR